MGFCSRTGSEVLCALPLLWLRRKDELCVGKSPVVWRLAVGTTGIVRAVVPKCELSNKIDLFRRFVPEKMNLAIPARCPEHIVPIECQVGGRRVRSLPKKDTVVQVHSKVYVHWGFSM